jgi:hypothetical protein
MDLPAIEPKLSALLNELDKVSKPASVNPWKILIVDGRSLKNSVIRPPFVPRLSMKLCQGTRTFSFPQKISGKKDI